MAQQVNCATDPHAASCGLDTTAHILRIVAMLLGIVLLVIVIAAIAIYQRNKNRKLTPDD